MSGHSKWTQIKRKKGTRDSQRGQLFSKLASAITLAVQEGGPSPETNLRLRMAIEKAKSANMPNINIERAIQKGDQEEGALAPITYEAFGPGGAALIIDCATNNKNRTVSAIKKVLEEYGGRLARTGSVKWNFKKVGIITIRRSKEQEELELSVIEAGARDLIEEKDRLKIISEPRALEKIEEKLKQAGAKVIKSELVWMPQGQSTKRQEGTKLVALVKKLKASPDVLRVFTDRV